MTDVRYWVWLQLGLGAEADLKEILSFFDSPKDVYDSSVLEWAVCKGISPAKLDRLSETSLEDADNVINECHQNGWDIIPYDDERYPAQLREIQRPPAVLYVSGDINCLTDRLCIAAVGTRKASAYAMKAARYLAKGLAQCGAVIISGGALGVDSATHEGALEAGGKTVAVLGCGLKAEYLRANQKLRDSIVETGGALVTEYPPDVRADRTTFPQRNRIISGLSRGVIVVEAAAKSGSLITAEYARKQGRDIFAIPASILDPAFQGTNKLIDEGAFVATNPRAVLSRYTDEYYTLDISKAESMYQLSASRLGANAPEKKQLTFDTVSENRASDNALNEKAAALIGVNRSVYDALGDGMKTPDEIEEITGVSNRKILTALTVLEVQGLVCKAEGDRYSKV